MDLRAAKRKPLAIAEEGGDELLKITVPAHRPIKRSTLAHILKQTRLGGEEFLQLL
jgi:hypothetical protein